MLYRNQTEETFSSSALFLRCVSVRKWQRHNSYKHVNKWTGVRVTLQMDWWIQTVTGREGYRLIVTLIQYPVYQKLAPSPVFFEVECVQDQLRLSQGVVCLLLGGKAHTFGHLCRVAARSLALDPHLQVHRCSLLALGPIVHSLRHIKALPASLVNGYQPVSDQGD